MRKWNAVISALILILFVVHCVAGGFVLAGFMEGGSNFLSKLTWVMMILVCAHIVIGIKLTADTLTALKKSGKPYFRENLVFWTRRISGFVLILMIILHLVTFYAGGQEIFRLKLFDKPQLIAAILLILALIVHILTNIRPLLISSGIAGFRIYVKDVLFVLAILLLLAACAFAVYYFRWNVKWGLV